uniref:DUF4216 domain-containing protein n=1 Tax=Cannabis sativa TaxID=3483 RepID=A0A803QE33_CANSA
MYFRGVETQFNPPERNDDRVEPSREFLVFKVVVRLLGKKTTNLLPLQLKQRAERYILNNCAEISNYLTNHLRESSPKAISDELYALANKLSSTVFYYLVMIVNGIKFIVHERGEKLKTQNSDVMVLSEEGENYYGELKQIIEFKYLMGYSVILIKCKWFNTSETKEDGNFTSVFVKDECYKDDPFILASLAKLMFIYPTEVSNVDELLSKSSNRFVVDDDNDEIPDDTLAEYDDDEENIVVDSDSDSGDHFVVNDDDDVFGSAVGKYGEMFNNYTAYLVRDNISPTTLSWNDVGKNDILVICRKSADKFICPMEDPIVLNNMDVNMQGLMAIRGKRAPTSSSSMSGSQSIDVEAISQENQAIKKKNQALKQNQVNQDQMMRALVQKLSVSIPGFQLDLPPLQFDDVGSSRAEVGDNGGEGNDDIDDDATDT